MARVSEWRRVSFANICFTTSAKIIGNRTNLNKTRTVLAIEKGEDGGINFWIIFVFFHFFQNFRTLVTYHANRWKVPQSVYWRIVTTFMATALWWKYYHSRNWNWLVGILFENGGKRRATICRKTFQHISKNVSIKRKGHKLPICSNWTLCWNRTNFIENMEGHVYLRYPLMTDTHGSVITPSKSHYNARLLAKKFRSWSLHLSYDRSAL